MLLSDKMKLRKRGLIESVNDQLKNVKLNTQDIEQ